MSHWRLGAWSIFRAAGWVWGQLRGTWYCGPAKRLSSRDLQWVPQRELGRTIAARVGENLGARKPGLFQECFFIKLVSEQQRLSQERETDFSVEVGIPLRLLIPWWSELEGNLDMSNFHRDWAWNSEREKHLIPERPQPDLLAFRPLLISLQYTALWFGTTVRGEKKSLENECFLKYHLQFIALRISHW